MAESVRILPGWYGKLPGLGDFSQRGLPPGFVAAWDQWLAQCLVASRAALGEAWLDIYLGSPLWRFCLFPGVVGEAVWAGVLMPSVDRVGRYFPLTIAADIRGGTLDLGSTEVTTWFADLERHALATLERAVSPDEMAAMMEAHPYPEMSVARSRLAAELTSSILSPQSHTLSLPSLAAVPALMSSAAWRLFLIEGTGKSLWWCQPHPDSATVLMSHPGLPHPDEFARMLDPWG